MYSATPTHAAKPFFALEPQSNANEGFNRYECSIAERGVFMLASGDGRCVRAWLRISTA